MEVMGLISVNIRQVTPITKGIALNVYFQAVRVVTVRADHPLVIHFALQKRGVNIDLILNLPVGKIEVVFQKRWSVCIQKRPTEYVILVDRRSTCMTAGTSLQG